MAHKRDRAEAGADHGADKKWRASHGRQGGGGNVIFPWGRLRRAHEHERCATHRRARRDAGHAQLIARPHTVPCAISRPYVPPRPFCHRPPKCLWQACNSAVACDSILTRCAVSIAGHMMFSVVDFLASKEVHSKDELAKAKSSVLSKTMLEGSARRDKEMSTLADLKKEVAPILDIEQLCREG